MKYVRLPMLGYSTTPVFDDTYCRKQSYDEVIFIVMTGDVLFQGERIQATFMSMIPDISPYYRKSGTKL